jgi:hypothetical protein
VVDAAGKEKRAEHYSVTFRFAVVWKPTVRLPVYQVEGKSTAPLLSAIYGTSTRYGIL